MGAPNLIHGGSHSGNVPAGDLAEASLTAGLRADVIRIARIGRAAVLCGVWVRSARVA